jgi:hypothetical protein
MQFGLFTLFDFFPDRQTEVAYYKDTLFHAGARDLRRARRGLELFAGEVMPAFR